MTVAEFLGSLRALDVQIVVEGDRLRINAPAGVLSDAHRSELARRKGEIITFLGAARQLASQQRAIVPLESRGSRTPIFAVAGHNGDVFCYRALSLTPSAVGPVKAMLLDLDCRKAAGSRSTACSRPASRKARRRSRRSKISPAISPSRCARCTRKVR